MNNIKENFKKFLLKQKYKSKCNKLSISNMMLEVLIERYNSNEVKRVLEWINKSKDFNDLKKNIIDFFETKRQAHISTYMLLGTITGKYSFHGLSFIDLKDVDFMNFKEDNYDETLEILKQNFYEYLLVHNEEKNKFLVDEHGNYNYTLDLDKTKCEDIFDLVIKGLDEQSNDKISECCTIVRNYIVRIIGIYGAKNIKENIDFILYDLTHTNQKPLLERKKSYLTQKNLTDNQRTNINNIDILTMRLKTLNSLEAKKLLERLDKINNSITINSSELDDIYLEYEILLRKDILSQVYCPTKKYTLVEDFKEMKPQLLHMFIRTPEKFRNDLEQEIVDDIIKQRKNNHEKKELTMEELNEYHRRKQAIDAMLDPTKINYFYNNTKFMYSDANGWNWYHSDAANQISASVYSSKYFLQCFVPWRMGVGFNSDNVLPEAIVLSAKEYLTTNKGLTNLEYDTNNEFAILSCTYQELLENDGKSEVVLFRRNMEYDTKASYIFVTVDSSDLEKYEKYIQNAKEKAEKSNLKLVIYDLYKIRNSYQSSLEMEKNIFEYEKNIEDSKRR